jgi:methionyl-tRNA synthetase
VVIEMQNILSTFNNIPSGTQTVFYIALVAWSIIWKGFALWRASKNNHKYWFIAILVFNTVGLLEILYLTVFGKRKPINEKKANIKK